MSVSTLWQKIKGTLETSFQIGGKTGPILANSSGQLTVNGLPITGGVRIKTVDLAFGSGSTVAVVTLPAGASIVSAQINVTTAFDGTPTVSLGVSGTTAKYTATTDVDLTTVGAYKMITDDTPAVSAENIIATYVAGSATVGAARISVTYATVT